MREPMSAAQSPISGGAQTVQTAQLLSSQRNWLRHEKVVEGAGAFIWGTVLRYRKRVLTGAVRSPAPPTTWTNSDFRWMGGRTFSRN